MKPLPNPVKINVTFIYTNENGETIPVTYLGPEEKLPNMFSRVADQRSNQLLTVETNKLRKTISQSLNIPDNYGKSNN